MDGILQTGSVTRAALIHRLDLIHRNASFESPGPMGKSAWDIAALLDGMGGTNYVSCTSTEFGTLQRYKLAFIDTSLNSYVAARPTLQRDLLAAFNDAISLLRAHTQCLELAVPGFAEFWDAQPGGEDIAPVSNTPLSRMEIVEAYEGISSFLATLQGTEIRSLAELIEWNNAHPVRKRHITSLMCRKTPSSTRMTHTASISCNSHCDPRAFTQTRTLKTCWLCRD